MKKNLYMQVLEKVQSFIRDSGGVDSALGKIEGSRQTLYRVVGYGATRPRLPNQIELIFKWLEQLGAKIVWPEDDTSGNTRDVSFINPKLISAEQDPPPPVSEDYLAVPLTEEPIAAGPGRVPSEAVKSWVIVWRHHESVRFKRNLVAVEIGKGERSMLPLFSPGDILLVDRDDTSPDPAGKIMLVREPGQEGGCMIKRVSMIKDDGDYIVTFYSENAREFPPMMYKLNRDYDGDITRAIAGHVVWAWSDVREK
jgi:hypothetical protein